MNWNLFFGIYVGLFAIASWICFYFLGIKKLFKENRCTCHTIGKIIRYSNVNYNGIHLPLVVYYVNNKQYNVIGPRFKSTIVTRISNPFSKINSKIESNLTDRQNLPKALKVKIYKNSLFSTTESPLTKIYPINSEVDVYYNPNKPKEAFVERYEGYIKSLIYFLLILSIMLTITMFYFLIGPKINF